MREVVELASRRSGKSLTQREQLLDMRARIVAYIVLGIVTGFFLLRWVLSNRWL